jgi:hypothetical protein
MMGVKLKTVDSLPRKDDETFKVIMEELEKSDGFMAISCWKSPTGTLYRTHYMGVGAEEIVYGAETIKREILDEDKL